MKKLLLLNLLALILVSYGCSTRLASFEKRRYNKGYHVDFAQKKNRTFTHEHFSANENSPATDFNENEIEPLNSVSEEPKTQDNVTEKISVSENTIQSESKPEKTLNADARQLKKPIKNKVISVIKKSIHNSTPERNTTGVKEKTYFGPGMVLGVIIAIFGIGIFIIGLVFIPHLIIFVFAAIIILIGAVFFLVDLLA